MKDHKLGTAIDKVTAGSLKERRVGMETGQLWAAGYRGEAKDLKL